MLGLKYWMGAIVAAGSLCSCSVGGEIGEEFSSFDDFGVAYTDTITLHTSTVLLDSLPTSGTGVMLVGRYNDEKLGVTSSNTFFQLSVGSSWTPESDALFDSLVLVLPYSDYYIGDTTQTQTFSFNRVTNDFRTYTLPQNWIDEEQYSVFFTTAIFNNRSMPDEEITSFSVTPRPHADSVTVRLPDDLGEYWLDQGKTENGIFTSTARFQDQYKGFSIRNISGQGSIFGFTTADIKIRVYYSQLENGLSVQRYYTVPYSTSDFQYNNISSDRSGTPLESLSPAKKIVRSYESGEETFIQSGVGVVTKIEFPYLATIQNLSSEYTLINNAYLTIEPVERTWSETMPLPPTLYLYQTNKTNLPTGPLYVDYDTEHQQSASIGYDTEYGTNTGYRFTITQYIQYYMTHANPEGKALLLTTPTSSLFKTLDRIVIGGANNPDYKMRLEIYYTRKN